MYDYEELLNRAIAKMPDIETTDARFVIPEPRVFSEGKTTILDNFGNIADILNREWVLEREKESRADAVKQSSATIRGNITQQVRSKAHVQSSREGSRELRLLITYMLM